MELKTWKQGDSTWHIKDMGNNSDNQGQRDGNQNSENNWYISEILEQGIIT